MKQENLDKLLLMLVENSAYYTAMEDLISLGANVNLKDEHGRTALSMAEKYNYKEIVEYLKSIGAKE